VNAHLLIAVMILIIAALVDLETRRIPNRLLIAGLFSHLLIWIFLEAPTMAILPAAVLIVTLFLTLLIPSLRDMAMSSIGMGDIKLIIYIALFISPFFDPYRWLIFMAISSALLGAIPLLLRWKERTLPFAPVLTMSTLLALW